MKRILVLLLALYARISIAQMTDLPFPGQMPVWTNPPKGPVGKFQAIFDDGFNGTSLDTRIWRTNLWYNGIINNEMQAYRPEQVTVAGGLLTIRAEKKKTPLWWTEKANNPWYPGEPVYKDYASGMIQTLNKFHFTRGIAEARMKIACCGKGLWDGFWILGADKPAGAEIDIVEVLNDAGHFNEKLAHFNYHTDGEHYPSEFISPVGLYWGFHVYTVEWSDKEIIFYVDGIERGKRFQGATFSKPMHLILNLAVGGNWPGPPNAQTTFPAQMVVDYVRVWKRL